MDAPSLASEMIDELLRPVDEAFGAELTDHETIASAQTACRDVAQTLSDIGEESAARALSTFESLLEVVSETLSDESADQSCAEIREFIDNGVKTVRESLSEECSETPLVLEELVESAHERWGDHLLLLPINNDIDTELGSSVDDFVEAEVQTGGQVDLILSALGDGSLADVTPPPVLETPKPVVANKPASAPRSETDALAADPELLEAYLEDAGQCLASMERAILESENDPQCGAPIEQLCRDLHTLKGASASVGLTSLASQIHEVEDALQASGDDSSTPPLELAMNCVDAVRSQIVALQSQPESPAITASASSQPAAPSPQMTFEDSSDAGDTVRVRTDELDRLMDLLADVVMWRSRREERVVELDRSEEEVSRSLFRLQAIEERARVRVPSVGDPATDSSSRLTDYVGEIASDLREVSRSLQGSRQALSDENRAISQFILQFRQQLVRIKRVPLAGLFQRLHRSVREAARAEGKDVRLEIRGENFGLERSLQEKLYEPLLHLVRNAVSHGIESADVRLANGKPEVGTVTLDAYGSPHVLMIEIRDDGGGLDYDAIRRRGLERGLITADRPVTKAELARLIFKPGFSTREETNEVSGRGVGMNVVEDTLHRCQCHIETESQTGQGTCFRLTIPLRSVIEHTLLFRCGGQSFGLPMSVVKAVSSGDTNVSQESSHVRPCRLNDLLQVSVTDNAESGQWIEIADRLISRVSQSVTDHSPEQRIRLYVDEVIGPEEVVVRSLPAMLRRHPHVSGMTLSGAGDVAFLLDSRRVLADALQCDTSLTQGTVPAGSASPNEASRTVLVVDDSLTARRKLSQLLNAAGTRSVEAADGLEAIEMVKHNHFDAIFSDLEMPRLNGFDLLGELEELGTDAPPCVIVTTRNEPEFENQAKSLGAAAFMAKPVDEAAVESVLHDLQLADSPNRNGDK